MKSGMEVVLIVPNLSLVTFGGGPYITLRIFVLPQALNSGRLFSFLTFFHPN